MGLNLDVILTSLPFIAGGAGVTLKFTLLSMIFGFPLGIGLAMAKISQNKFFMGFARAYTSLFRGTPLLVQLSLFYFALPQLTGYSISAFEAGVLTFSLNSAAYSSEIIRAGIQSIDKGQGEAARTLGLSDNQTLRTIIMPQAFKNILPSLVNEYIDLIKESAIVSIIGEADLLRRAQIVASEKYLYFEPLLAAAGGYYLMVLSVSALAKMLERKMAYA
jgi:His/Glu/Gln/Arg/opine family amino acid ABC transporter permease subunit